MAIGVVVQAVGSATSSSSSCNMPHRQRRRIFLDYTSFFSGKCMLLRQFYPSTLFSCRRLSLLVSSELMSIAQDGRPELPLLEEASVAEIAYCKQKCVFIAQIAALFGFLLLTVLFCCCNSKRLWNSTY
ncbi:hypothetical protein DAI22_02g094101 [Oryza sativa Japonica Group]|nr:hypothetical protein DAI22_02g094101 [Oryza sativa Japonica Group]